MNITCQQMKLMDSYTINTLKIPSIVLMERASLMVVDNIDLDNNHRFTIVCGVGNNGGDGLALARHLHLKDKEIDLFIVGDLTRASKDFNINLEILKNLNLDYININTDKDIDLLKDSSKKSNMTIDSIFGVGLSRPIEGIFFDTIKTINDNSKYILNIDIPSGIDGDTGEVLGINTRSDLTITFHKMKTGLVDNDKIEKIIVADIGIPDMATKAILDKKNPKL